MMEFEEFIEKTARELEKSFEGKTARLREVLKNNGVRRRGIILYSPGETAFPTEKPPEALGDQPERTGGMRPYMP